MLHGYGSNKNDLISIAPDLAQYTPNSLFISPDAPERFEGGVPGSYQWFSLVDRDEERMYNCLCANFIILDKFIEECLVKYQIDIKKVGIFGFSQGGMVSLHYALEKVPYISCAICNSGMLISPHASMRESISGPDILLIHGDQDQVVPFSAMRFSRHSIEKGGINVRCYVAEGLAHGIDQGCIKAAGNFLSDHFGAKKGE
ncbi:Alpha/beta hydrolase [Candidatus Cyrtobacter comes]|uniref:Alpha/beta hydrolase n=1 Tax=Candidatus Cyrtobacter comes TaxID=675776 RepID=A0ABU5L7V9_9RICK|nr:alpha/beta fold hydrolase [Candidatus Cyrtobacter comes]MDZ5762212.1 Alpha/beta hydrolase [Candidatus Cyrtobacter comes]